MLWETVQRWLPSEVAVLARAAHDSSTIVNGIETGRFVSIVWTAETAKSDQSLRASSSGPRLGANRLASRANRHQRHFAPIDVTAFAVMDCRHWWAQKAQIRKIAHTVVPASWRRLAGLFHRSSGCARLVWGLPHRHQLRFWASFLVDGTTWGLLRSPLGSAVSPASPATTESLKITPARSSQR
jgi:hypothetical protein